jgi:dTDP-glucose pyrophosphorylase
MNILLLMAGGSEAFEEAGYLYPKNLVEIDGLPLAQRVIDSVIGLRRYGSKFVCLVQTEEDQQYHTADVIRLLVPDAVVVEVPAPTAGAACTALLAIEHIGGEEPLLIANGDQILAADLTSIANEFQRRELDGGIIVFEAVHPRWSYVKCDEEGWVVETAEKRPISNLATAGMYYFARGSDFVTAAMQMIVKDAQVGGNFYVCPVYNELILKQGRIGVSKIRREEYFSLANPQGVHAYEEYLRTHPERQ